MNYALNEKYELIQEEIQKHTKTNPIDIVKNIMHKDYINIHGPEHHFLDGAAFLVAYKNAGGNIDLDVSLDELANRTIKMPGAMCGQWGVCGSSTAVGAALSIIHKTGPLSNDDYYKDNMEFTSSVIALMSKIGGPRCCKRNAFLSLSCGVEFVNRKYKIPMQISNIICEFSNLNQQCIKEKCPFHKN